MKALRPATACVVQLAVCCTEYTVQCTLHVQNSTALEISLVNYLRRWVSELPWRRHNIITFQRHTTVRALCTVHHCSSWASYVGVAHKRTRSGNARWSMQITHSEGQRNGARRHNSVLLWRELARAIALHVCYMDMYMWAVEKNLDRQWRNGWCLGLKVNRLSTHGEKKIIRNSTSPPMHFTSEHVK